MDDTGHVNPPDTQPSKSLSELAHRMAILGATGAWAGPIAFVLALAVGTGLAASLIIISLSPRPLDSSLEAVVTTLAGAAVGAVGTYLGTTHRDRDQPPGGTQDGG